MSTATADTTTEEGGELKRTITGRLLYFYVLGDVLGSGIYVLIGSVAGAVGGAFWLAFAVGVTIAAITGTAYAELVTKYPRAAGAALFVQKAFGNRVLTFMVTVSMLSALFAASGSLASGFGRYFATVWELPPTLLVTLAFIFVLTIVNYLGITESVVANMVMTVVEVTGLVIVMIIGVWALAEGSAEPGRLTDFSADSHPILAVVAGVALAFFAMTGFENTANVAEETIDPKKCYPRALILGMLTAGVIYVLVAMAASITVSTSTLADSPAALLTVVEEGVLPLPVGFMTIAFSIIAMIAITNTTLVGVVTQPRILYGMAREDVVPGAFGKIHAQRKSPVFGLVFSGLVVAALLVIGSLLNKAGLGVDLVDRLAGVTVVFLLFIYALVIVATFKLRGQDEEAGDHYRANSVLLVIGLIGNAVLLCWVVYDDPHTLIWCAGLVAVGVALFLVEHLFGRRDGPVDVARGDVTPGR